MIVPKKIRTENLASSIEEQPAASRSYIQEEQFTDEATERRIRIEELNTIKEYNRTLSQNNDERKKYAHKIFTLTMIWSAFIFVILFLTGWKIIQLSDTTIITLITSTTVNFFGFFYLVTRYLFNTGLPEKADRSKTG
jgi:hypothetical protein